MKKKGCDYCGEKLKPEERSRGFCSSCKDLSEMEQESTVISELGEPDEPGQMWTDDFW